jgi:phenylacetate-CoA ligase
MSADPNFFATIQRFIAGQRPYGPDLTEIRAQRIQRIVRHASEHVPLYRELYRRHGVDVESIRTPADLWRLPSVSKVDYLRVGAKGYTDDRGDLLNLYSQTTSGSVGRAMTMYSTQPEAQRLLANLWSGWLGLGVKASDRLLMMSAPYLAEQVEPFSSFFVPVKMTEEETVAAFKRFRPTVVIGSVESIALLAAELKRREIDERHGVRLLFPFGQTCSEQHKRMFASGFAAEVFVLYGSAEGGWLGYECEKHNGFHVPEGRIDVQIAQTGKPDEPAAPRELGEVILTSFLRGTNPFIRYRLHDAAALDDQPCACGRTAPRIVQLEGRIQDFLVASDGKWIGPASLAIDLVKDRPAIIDHRIVQPDPDHLVVSIVLDPDLPAPDPAEIEKAMRRHLGPLEVEVVQVESVPRDPSGKRRRVFRMFDLPDR